MNDEQRGQGRDASAAPGAASTDQYPAPSYPGGPDAAGHAGPSGPPTAQLPPPREPGDGLFAPMGGHPGGPPPPHTAPYGAQQPPRKRGMAGIVTAAVLAGLIGGGAGAAGTYAVLNEGSIPALTSSPQGSESVDAAPGSVSAAAATITPSTVVIRSASGQGVSEGSGVVLTAQGDVLTNNHVVAGGEQITVTMSDGTEHAARLVGTAPSYDLAVIRLDGVSGLTPATLGESEALQVGQQVVAVGSPRGLTGTVTTGIVSALDRTVTVPGEDSSIVVYNGLQTDAPINQGNSGGPLVNLEGQVVGINSAIQTSGGQDGGSIGLGFAIPVDQARRVAQEIMDTGQATKPVLGVQGNANQGGGVSGTGGAPIAAVQPGSPAEAAGLRQGDIITRVGDDRVANFADLMARVGAHIPGEQVELTVTGAGGDRTVQATLGSQPDRAATSSPAGGSGGGGSPGGGSEGGEGGEGGGFGGLPNPFGGGN